MAAKYFDIEGGTCLLKREETASKLEFSVLDRTGNWRTGTAEATDLGVRYTVEHSESGVDEISERAASKLAKKLGSEL